jgi:hypothetical protein
VAKRKAEAQGRAVEQAPEGESVMLQQNQAEAVFALVEKRERIIAEVNAQLRQIEDGLSGLAAMMAGVLGMPTGEGWRVRFENGEGQYEDKRPRLRLVAQKTAPVANPTLAPVAEQPPAEPAA